MFTAPLRFQHQENPQQYVHLTSPSPPPTQSTKECSPRPCIFATNKIHERMLTSPLHLRHQKCPQSMFSPALPLPRQRNPIKYVHLAPLLHDQKNPLKYVHLTPSSHHQENSQTYVNRTPPFPTLRKSTTICSPHRTLSTAYEIHESMATSPITPRPASSRSDPQKYVHLTLPPPWPRTSDIVCPPHPLLHHQENPLNYIHLTPLSHHQEKPQNYVPRTPPFPTPPKSTTICSPHLSLSTAKTTH